jgi:1-acyl-sn-glycerol-3-phosphate acyltransferase
MKTGSEQFFTRPNRKAGLYTAYKWIFIAPFLVFSTAVFGSAIIIVSFLGAPDFASRIFGPIWAKLNTTVSFIDVKTTGLEHIVPGQSYVVVANHQSLIDIYLLYGFLGMDIKWVMKQELRTVPVLGLACEMMGHVIIDRSNTAAALASMDRARGKIKEGMSVVFFAEGTRSRNGELMPFKKGAFRMAQALNLPILPITIHNTLGILPSDTLDLRPGRAWMTIGKPIEISGLKTFREEAKVSGDGEEPSPPDNAKISIKSLDNLMAEVRRSISSNLQHG